MTISEVIAMFDDSPHEKRITKMITDDAGGGVIYYGWTKHSNTDTAIQEWSIVRGLTVGGLVNYDTPKDAGTASIGPRNTWDGRAALTY